VGGNHTGIFGIVAGMRKSCGPAHVSGARQLGRRRLARRPLCLERGGIALKRFGHPATKGDLLRFRGLRGLPSVVSGARAEIDEATMGFGGIGHGDNNAIAGCTFRQCLLG
jgi:hypothetical protein